MRKIHRHSILYLIFICLLICNINTFAQSISIEFSIELKNIEKNICENNKLSTIPYLNLSYKNNTSDSLYFFKIIDNFYFTALRTHNPLSKGKSKCLDRLKFHSNEKYKVVIGNSTFNSIPEIFENDADLHAEHEGNIINDEIQDIYTYILHDSVFKNSFYFEKNPIVPTEENIKTKLKDYVVFLKPGETYVQSFDLTGFYIIGGSYEFIIYKEKIDNYIEVSSFWDENQKKWIYKKDYLPSIVNGYKLYSGEIKTNRLNIIFSGMK
jgi:hypothetical protein